MPRKDAQKGAKGDRQHLASVLERRIAPAFLRSSSSSEKTAQDAFQDTVDSLAKIIKEKLYHDLGYKSAEDYAKRRWRISKEHMYRLVRCARLLAELSEFGLKPSCEAVCREVLATSAKLNEPVDFVWRQVLEMKSSGTASALTAATVRTLTATGGSSSTQGGSPSRYVKYAMSSVETEYNTPEWLSKLILSFFSEGIALDPASNPDSAIPASIKYGRQSDGTFVDALKLPAWVVDSAVKTCYLNPPGGKIDGNVSVQGAFIDKLLGQIGNGYIDEALVLVPISFKAKWFQKLLARFPVAFFADGIEFELRR